MKKSNYLLLGVLTTLLLVSCGPDKPHSTTTSRYEPDTTSSTYYPPYTSNNDSSTSNEPSSESSSSSSSTTTNKPNIENLGGNESFESFQQGIENSHPTRIVTNVTYYLAKYEITLTFSSTLLIEYGTETLMSYNYSYQELNPSGSDEMISTYQGVIFARGNDVGQLIKGEIDWNVEIEGYTSLFSILLEQDIFAEGSNINGYTFNGIIRDDMVSSYFGFDAQVKSCSVKMIIDETKKVTFMQTNYTTIKEGASVNISSRYSYRDEVVNYPGR